MSTLKTDAVTALSSNGDLSLDGLGTGGVSIASTLKMTKGGDIASASPLVIDTDGNYYDVTGTTNFSAMTVEAGNFFMLQFDGALTITHGSGIELPGAANLTTATGDRLMCYATAANTVEVMSVELETAATAASGGWVFLETLTADTTTPLVFTHTVAANFDYMITFRNIDWTADPGTAMGIQLGTGAGPTFSTSGYVAANMAHNSTAITVDRTTPLGLMVATGAETIGGTGAGETHSGQIQIYDPGANAETDSFSNYQGETAANAYAAWESRSRRETAEVVTAFRTNQTTSNMATGTLKLFRRAIT
jgi:hypothetical protein